MSQLTFAVLGILILAGALLAVANGNLVRGVYWLIVTLVGTAMLYGAWGASFLAVVQLLTYVGGVATLMIFGIMVTRRHEGAAIPSQGSSRFGAALLSAGVFAVLASAIWTTDYRLVAKGGAPPEDAAGLARVLLGDQLLAFEAASAVLLAGIVAAVVMARRNDAAPAPGKGGDA